MSRFIAIIAIVLGSTTAQAGIVGQFRPVAGQVSPSMAVQTAPGQPDEAYSAGRAFQIKAERPDDSSRMPVRY